MVVVAAVGPVRADAGTAGGVDQAAQPEAADLAGQVWVPEVVLDAFGQATDAGELPGVEGEALAKARSPGARRSRCSRGFMPGPTGGWR
jgi:hypothetical protein